MVAEEVPVKHWRCLRCPQRLRTPADYEGRPSCPQGCEKLMVPDKHASPGAVTPLYDPKAEDRFREAMAQATGETEGVKAEAERLAQEFNLKLGELADLETAREALERQVEALAQDLELAQELRKGAELQIVEKEREMNTLRSQLTKASEERGAKEAEVKEIAEQLFKDRRQLSLLKWLLPIAGALFGGGGAALLESLIRHAR